MVSVVRGLCGATEALTKDISPDFLKKVMSEPTPKECVERDQVNKGKVEERERRAFQADTNRGLETRGWNPRHEQVMEKAKWRERSRAGLEKLYKCHT